MSDDSFTPPENDVWTRKRRPAKRGDQIWVTYGFFLACLVLFVINMKRKSAMDALDFQPLGWRSAIDVWQGDWWALSSTAFVHLEPFHIAFNLYWLWVLGVVMERKIGALPFFLFYLAAGFVSSAMQMWLGGSVGIGASGAMYGVFGFMWIARTQVREFGECLGMKTWHILLVWLFICLPLSWSNVLPIANVAHFAGMAVGILGGAIYAWPKFRIRALVGSGAVVIATIVSLFWAPWSPAWLLAKVDSAIRSGNQEEAAKYISKLASRKEFTPQQLKDAFGPQEEE